MLHASASDVLLLLCRPETGAISLRTEESAASSGESQSATWSSASTVIPASSYAPHSDVANSDQGWATDRVSPVGEDSEAIELNQGVSRCIIHHKCIISSLGI